jgi:hypothetical protein
MGKTGKKPSENPDFFSIVFFSADHQSPPFSFPTRIDRWLWIGYDRFFQTHC